MAVMCKDIMRLIETFAPVALKVDGDNVGLLVGDDKAVVSTVLVTLDVTDAVVAEAAARSVDLIVAHHPMIYGGLNQINNSTSVGRRIMRLIQNRIGVYAAHTNLDATVDGINDVLFDMLGLVDKDMLEKPNDFGLALGRTGLLPEQKTLGELTQTVKDLFGLQFMNVAGNLEWNIQKVGVMSGQGASLRYIQSAHDKGCDVLITGDVTYHLAQAAIELGMGILDATHYATEVVIVEKLCEHIKKEAAANNWALDVFASEINCSFLQTV